MIRFYALLILTFSIATFADSKHKIELIKPENTQLYSVTSKSGKTSYLLGTIHYGVGLNQLPNYVEALFRQAKIHVTESKNVFEPYPESIVSLQSFYSEKTYEQYRKRSKRTRPEGRALTKEQAQRLIREGYPKYLIDNLVQETKCSIFEIGTLPFDAPFKMLDRELGQISAKLKVERYELDTPEVQTSTTEAAKEKSLSLNDNSEDDCRIGDILNSDKDLSSVAAFRRGVGAASDRDNYVAGVILPLGTRSNFDVEFRNEKWLKPIMVWLERGSAFIFVGAGHLEGKKGLVQSLREQGYNVERVRQDPRIISK